MANQNRKTIYTQKQTRNFYCLLSRCTEAKNSDTLDPPACYVHPIDSNLTCLNIEDWLTLQRTAISSPFFNHKALFMTASVPS